MLKKNGLVQNLIGSNWSRGSHSHCEVFGRRKLNDNLFRVFTWKQRPAKRSAAAASIDTVVITTDVDGEDH